MVFVQRLVALLETGRRNSTYKLAVLLALIDIALERPAANDGTLAVPVREVAHRVVDYYWRQVRPYAEHGMLHQMASRQTPAIPVFVAEAREQLAAKRIFTPAAARELGDPDYERAVSKVEMKLAANPLTYLQTPTAKMATAQASSARIDFIFDASGFHNKMTRSELDAHGPLVLRPGVADAFREFAGLIKPVIEIMWITDVAEWNRQRLDTDDLAGFLFGAERTALVRTAPGLRELQNNKCFYCERAITGTAHVDHVLPWSKIPIDGIANFVAADGRCNLDKSATVPTREHFERALARPEPDLRSIAESARMPLLLTRTRDAGTGIYRSLPEGAPLWAGPGVYLPHRAD
jgi:hypothetical protein